MVGTLSYITTYSKIHFTPTEPNEEDIKMEDIAHALSLLCRANGHFKTFFSVAQHSLNCAVEAKSRGCSDKVQLACLLHDASEAYLSDITRPVKKELPIYRRIEEKLQNMIWNKFLTDPLTDKEIKQVFEIDDAMLYFEFEHYMQESVLDYIPVIKSQPEFDNRSFESVEGKFLKTFQKLTGEVKDFLCVGIDWYSGKWLAVALSANGFEVNSFPTIDEICSKYQDADSIIIDIPIGLPESQGQVKDRPDGELRKRIGKKSSSVFTVPFRQIVYAPNIQIAWDLNRQLNAGLNPPSMGIRDSIRQVDSFLQNNPHWKNKLLESHPEYCFFVLDKNRTITDRKQYEAGQRQRLEILKQYYPQAQLVIDSFLSQSKSRKKIDDVIDALCLALVGKLGLSSGFCTVPDMPQRDATGLKMQIVMADI